MCGRYVSPVVAEMERFWQLTDAQIRNPLAQRFNISPTASVPMLHLGEDGTLEEVAARWA
jgi:putative SOS response-associated peptidase YedK